MSIRYAIDAYVAKAVEAVDDDDLSCAGEDAAKVARILSDVAVNIATLDAQEDDPRVQLGDVRINDEGDVLEWHGFWHVIDHVGEVPAARCECRMELDDFAEECTCDDAAYTGVCDDPDCGCHDATCDDCGADLGFTDDDVIVTLRVGDNGFSVNVEGPICQEHGDALVADVFDLAHKHFGDDEGSLVDRAASDVVVKVHGPTI